ncbi:MAG: DHHA1 domain-containing protein, partial [Candidatus Saccharicenans sp.]
NRRRWLQDTARLFSAEEAEVYSCAEKNLVELKALKKKQKKLEEKLSFFEAREILAGSPGKIVSGLFPEKSPEEIKFLALNLVHQAEVIAVLAAFRNEAFHLVVAASENLKVDLRELVPVLQEKIEFKGGGSPTLIELVSQKKEEAEKAIKLAVDFLSSKIG